MMTTRSRPFLTVDPSVRASAPAWRQLPTDVERSDDAVTLRIDVPGVSADDVNVVVTGRLLKLEVSRPAPTPSEHRRSTERWSGTVRRELQLGEALDGSAVSAALDAGVLTLTIPVREAAKEQRIEVAVGPAALTEGTGDAESN